MRMYFHCLLIFYAGTNCMEFISGLPSVNYDATKVIDEMLAKILEKAEYGLKALNQRNFQINSKDLQRAKINEIICPHPGAAPKSGTVGFEAAIRCKFTKSLQIEVQLPDYEFSCCYSCHMLITRPNVSATVTFGNKDPKSHFSSYADANSFVHSNFQSSDNGTISPDDLSYNIPPAVQKILENKLKPYIQNNTSPFKVCARPTKFLEDMERYRNDLYYYNVENRVSQRSFFFDLEIEWIRVKRFWDIGSLTLKHNSSSNASNFVLRWNKLGGEIAWGYTLHKEKGDKKFNITKSDFVIGTLTVEGYLKRTKLNHDVSAVVSNITFPNLCGDDFKKILSKEMKKIIERNFISIFSKLIGKKAP